MCLHLCRQLPACTTCCAALRSPAPPCPLGGAGQGRHSSTSCSAQQVVQAGSDLRSQPCTCTGCGSNLRLQPGIALLCWGICPLASLHNLLCCAPPPSGQGSADIRPQAASRYCRSLDRSKTCGHTSTGCYASLPKGKNKSKIAAEGRLATSEA